MASGETSLYIIKFPNRKVYLGIAYDPEQRYRTHCKTKRRTPVSAALRKYKRGVSFRVLAKGERSYILDLEIKAIAAWKSQDRRYGYNIARGGETSPVEGVGHSKSTRKKMSISQRNRNWSRGPALSKKMSDISKRRVMTDAYRANLSAAAKKRWSVEELSLRLKKLSEEVAYGTRR